MRRILLTTCAILIALPNLLVAGCSQQASMSQRNTTVSRISAPPYTHVTTITTATTTTNANPVNVPFSVGVYRRGNHYMAKADFDAQIILNRVDLEKQDALNWARLEESYAHTSIRPPPSLKTDDIGKYTAGYFEDHALVYVRRRQMDILAQDRFNALSITRNKLTIDYTILHSYPTGPMFTGWLAMLEVRKSDIVGVTEIVPKEGNETVTASYGLYTPDPSKSDSTKSTDSHNFPLLVESVKSGFPVTASPYADAVMKTDQATYSTSAAKTQFTIKKRSDHEVMTGEPYSLEIFRDNAWYIVPFKKLAGNVVRAWPAVGYPLPAQGVLSGSISLSEHVPLIAGRYRLVKEILTQDRKDYWGNSYIWAEFKVISG